MSFLESPQFPSAISYGAKGGPNWRTKVVEHTSGDEQRVIEWSKTRGRYDVGHTIKTEAQLHELITFFNVVRGRAHGFRFKDWMDYRASVDGTFQTIGTVTVALETSWQTIKTYSNAGGSYVRTINKPVNNSTFVLKDNGTIKTITTQYTVDWTTGIITLLYTPTSGHVLTAYYEFDVPARFDTDWLEATIEAYNNSNWPSIPIVEIRIR